MSERLRNTVKERRLARGWTLQALAERCGTTVGTINRIETGETKLLHDLVPAIGAALGCPWQDLFVDDAAPVKINGFNDEAAPFQPDANSALAAITLGENRDLWTVKSDALDAIGIAAGTPVVVNIGQDAVDRVQSLDPVIIQLIDEANPLRAVTLLRQFIEPDLYITNSTHANTEPLSRRTHDVRVKGVVENVITPTRFSRS